MQLLAVLGCALSLLSLLSLVSLLSPGVADEQCPPPCSCSSLGDARGTRVDCASRGLRSLPALPRLTRSLLLHNNSLASIPSGALDGLGLLQELNLSHNPWHCDCRLLYLRLWLEDAAVAALAPLRCASPAALRLRALQRLTGNELGPCKRLLPTKCLQFFWRDLLLIAGAIISLVLAACALKLSKKLRCRLLLGARRGRIGSKNRKVQ